MRTSTERGLLAQAAAAGVLLALSACSNKPQGPALTAGDFQVRLALQPDPPVAGDNTLRVELRDAEGKSVENARLSFLYDMPAMGAMPEMKGDGESKPLGGGRYAVTYPLAMLGDWSLTLGIEAEGHPAASLRFKVSPPRKGYTVEQRSAASRENVQLLEISPERQQLIGVVYGSVERRPLSLSLRAAGRVEVDESQISDVVLKYDAYVEKLFVSRTGQPVKAGEPLLSLYSPELYAAEQDLLVAKRSAEGHVPGSDQLLRAARERLRLWNLTAAQIASVEKTGKAAPRVTLRAPNQGFVLEKSVVEGTRAAAGSVLYRIGNLGRIWVVADLFESDAPLIASGQAATLTVPWAGGASLSGRVEFVYPTIDEKTRSLRARLSFANQSLSLKPGMFVDVRIEAPLGTRLSVPDSALLVSGEHRYAFVQRGEGKLQAVEVVPGALAGEYDEVLSGLREGDKVATQATFLLSSEAQLRAALPRWASP
ncbi:MAG TPA: efflux RND transporter periplasmic adaptor subunit [Myxococcales bacterium]|jgi:Cu(I)/Ag(I) efflux system membrane fusion protein